MDESIGLRYSALVTENESMREEIGDLRATISCLGRMNAELMKANTEVNDACMKDAVLADQRNDTISRLETELAETKRDAERYRWLSLTSDTNPLMICDVQSGRLLFGYEADAEIDIHRYGGGA